MPRRSAEESRENLVDAAIRVMVRDGVAAASTRAIVAEAGLPLGAFHYCFRSKAELLHSVIETIMAKTLPPTVTDGATPEDDGRRDPAAVIGGSIDAYWRRIQAEPDEQMVTYELTQYALRHPELADVARAQYRQYRDVFREYLAAIASVADVRWKVDVAVLARYGFGVMDGLTLNWLIDRDDAQARAALDEFAGYLIAAAEPRGD
jgi:AcrR family transcriptional regulator